MLVNMLHMNEAFMRMRLRHNLWKERYPDSKRAYGAPFTGLSNARPETKALYKPPVQFKDLPFDPYEFIKHVDDLEFDPNMDPDLGR